MFITRIYYTYFYLFHFFIELTSARYGARADALAPQSLFNKPIYYGLIQLNVRRYYKQMSMPTPCWNFQQVMSLKSATPLCTAGSGCMDKHPSYVEEQTFYRQVSGPESIKNCSLRRRSAMLEWGTPGPPPGYPPLSELSQVKHQAASSQSCLDKLL